MRHAWLAIILVACGGSDAATSKPVSSAGGGAGADGGGQAGAAGAGLAGAGGSGAGTAGQAGWPPWPPIAGPQCEELSVPAQLSVLSWVDNVYAGPNTLTIAAFIGGGTTILDLARAPAQSSSVDVLFTPLLDDSAAVTSLQASAAPGGGGTWLSTMGYHRTNVGPNHARYARAAGDKKGVTYIKELPDSEFGIHLAWDGVGYALVRPTIDPTSTTNPPAETLDVRHFSAAGEVVQDWTHFGDALAQYGNEFRTDPVTGITWAWIPLDGDLRVIARDRQGKLLPGMEPKGYTILEGWKMSGGVQFIDVKLIPGKNGALVVGRPGNLAGTLQSTLWAQAVGLDGLPVSDGFSLETLQCGGGLPWFLTFAGAPTGDGYTIITNDHFHVASFVTTMTALVSRRSLIEDLTVRCVCDDVCDPRMDNGSLGLGAFAAWEWQGSAWLGFRDESPPTSPDRRMRIFRDDGVCTVETLRSKGWREGKYWTTP